MIFLDGKSVTESTVTVGPGARDSASRDGLCRRRDWRGDGRPRLSGSAGRGPPALDSERRGLCSEPRSAGPRRGPPDSESEG